MNLYYSKTGTQGVMTAFALTKNSAELLKQLCSIVVTYSTMCNCSCSLYLECVPMQTHTTSYMALHALYIHNKRARG